MPNFTYNRDIPDAPNNPSNDQGPMKVNTNSIDDLIEIDHFSFNDNNGGFHKQVTYADVATAGAQVDPSSISFTSAGTAAPSHPQLFWKNSQATFPLSAIRAFGTFTTGVSPTNITPDNQYNVSGTISQTTVGFMTTWVVNLNANTTNTDNAAVFIYYSAGFTFPNPSYTFAANVLTIKANSFGFFSKINFLILQI